MKGAYLFLLVVLGIGVVQGFQDYTCPQKDLTRFCDCFGDDWLDPAQRFDMMSRKCKQAFYSKCRKINDKSDYIQHPYNLEMFVGFNRDGCPPPLPCSVVDLAYSTPVTRGSKLFKIAEENQCAAVLNYLPDRHFYSAQQREQIALALTFLRAYLGLNLGIGQQCFPFPAPATPPPQPEVDAKCEGKPNGNYGIGDCRKFVACSNQIGSVIDCPAGTFFDEAINACDFQPHPNCNSGVSSGGGNGGDDDDDDDSGNGGGAVSLDSLCQGKSDGNYPYPENCAKFIQCAAGKAYLTDCVMGTFYDAKYDACNVIMVDGCDSSGSGTDDNTPSDSGNPPDIDLDPNYCEHRHNGNYPIEDCSIFATCSGGNTYYTECPSNTYFDDTQNACVWWEDHKGTCPSRH